MWCSYTSNPSRRGVTVIELLVVISIIGALAAITLPALSASRESARRTVCQNNLRNVALAVDLHHSSHGRYPVSDFRVPEGVGPDSRSWSFFALLLPHLERRDLYNAIYHAGHLEPVESETVESEEGEEEERNEKFVTLQPSEVVLGVFGVGSVCPETRLGLSGWCFFGVFWVRRVAGWGRFLAGGRVFVLFFS